MSRPDREKMSTALKAKMPIPLYPLGDLKHMRRLKKRIKESGIKGDRFCIEAQAAEWGVTAAFMKIVLKELEYNLFIIMEKTDVPCENKVHSESDFMMSSDADLQILYEPCFMVHFNPRLYTLNQEELIEYAGKRMAESIMWIKYSIERDKNK